MDSMVTNEEDLNELHNRWMEEMELESIRTTMNSYSLPKEHAVVGSMTESIAALDHEATSLLLPMGHANPTEEAVVKNAVDQEYIDELV
jgi:hypothetical protein